MATIRHKMGHLESWPTIGSKYIFKIASVFNKLGFRAIDQTFLFEGLSPAKNDPISFLESNSYGNMAKFVGNRCHTRLWDGNQYSKQELGTMFSVSKSTIDRIVRPGPVKLRVEAKARKPKRTTIRARGGK